MDTIFINSKNSKRSDSHRLLLNLTDKINLKRSDKYIKHLPCHKFKNSAARWNEEFGLPDGTYFVSDIKNYFEYILKNVRQLLIIYQY